MRIRAKASASAVFFRFSQTLIRLYRYTEEFFVICFRKNARKRHDFDFNIKM